MKNKNIILLLLATLILQGCLFSTAQEDICKVYQDDDAQKILRQIEAGQKTLDEMCSSQ